MDLATADSCDSEWDKREDVEFAVGRPAVTDHLGPVTIASLDLPQFFDCLRNNTNLTSIVGYLPGVVSINVNVSMGELGNYNESLLTKCCSTNEFGLTQFDYLVFTEGWREVFTGIDRADQDQQIVRSNIAGQIGDANPDVNGELRLTNSTIISESLYRRGADMTINLLVVATKAALPY